MVIEDLLDVPVLLKRVHDVPGAHIFMPVALPSDLLEDVETNMNEVTENAVTIKGDFKCTHVPSDLLVPVSIAARAVVFLLYLYGLP